MKLLCSYYNLGTIDETDNSLTLQFIVMQVVKHFRIVSVVTFGLIVAASQPAVAERASGRPYCGKDGETPTTVVDNGSRTVGLIRWVANFAGDSEWTPQARCEQVSKKLAQNQESGALVEIVPAQANGYRVLCASPSKVDSSNYTCPDAQILLTLRPDDPDPSVFIDRLFELNTGKSSEAIRTGNALTKINGVSNLNFSLLKRYARPTSSLSTSPEPKKRQGLFF